MTGRRWTVGMIAAMALALRLGYSWARPALPRQPDAFVFDRLAVGLVEQHQFGIPTLTASRPPVYPFFLASVYQLAGHHVRAAQVAQALLGVLGVLLLIAIARELFSDSLIATLAGTLAAIYPFFIYYESSLLSEGLTTFLLIFSLWCFLRWRRDDGSWTFSSALALSLSALALIRTPFLAMGTITLAIEAYRRRGAAQAWAAILLFCIPLIGWGLRNQHRVGRLTLDTHGGYTLFECVNNYATNKEGRFGELWPTLPACAETARLSEPEADLHLRQKVTAFIRTHPKTFFKQSLANVGDFWRLYPRQDITYAENLHLITVLSLLFEPFLLIAGIAGFWLTRRQWHRLYPIYLSILFLFGVHVISCSQMRYRVPLMPFLILMAAISVSSAIKTLVAKRS